MINLLKNIIRPIIYAICFVVLIPFFIFSRLRLASFLTLNTILGTVPGWPGMFLRRVWYKLNLRECGKNLYVDYGGVFRTRKAKVGDNVYVGRRCLVGNVHMGNNITISHQSFIMSSKSQHGLSRSKPHTQQIKKNLGQTKIGDDVWVCLNSVVASDLSKGTIVGANSYVNKVFDEYSIIAGSPAKLIKKRPA
jgi:acetyltransferase-like isoleucine patch superfamily enzyme